MGNYPGRKRVGRWHRRRGAATLDYVLILMVILPLVAFMMGTGRRIILLAYEMVCMLVGWPFM